MVKMALPTLTLCKKLISEQKMLEVPFYKNFLYDAVKRHIVENEGARALWRGLGPNLVGVAPSRAIYFCSYSQMKVFLANHGGRADSPVVHVMAASWAGFSACIATNPIWFVKTRLQLDNTRITTHQAVDLIRSIYSQQGLMGFYKGITASFYGISETVIHFVIYEAIKAKLQSHRHITETDDKSSRDFLEFMAAGATSKTISSCLCYPHEVARTRLREEGNKYHKFWQTLRLVVHEEGWRGLYRGLSTQLIRQIPNTAIMMATYEGVVYVLTRYAQRGGEFYEEDDPFDSPDEQGQATLTAIKIADIAQNKNDWNFWSALPKNPD